MDRVTKALHGIDRAGRGLEIGPSYSPLVTKESGARIETLDHATRDELVAKYRGYGLGEEELARIEEVDHIWHGGSLLDVLPERGCYDYIIASHFIEHTVDLIGFLRDCEELLVPGGRIALVVPDKRYCFDRFQPLSTVGQVVDAHHHMNDFHSAGPLVDHQAYAATKCGVVAWSRYDEGPLAVQFPNFEGGAEAEANGVAQQEYFDIHRWKFTPTSFDLLIRDLVVLGHHRLGVVESFGTEGFEFFVTVAKNVPAGPAPDRLALLLTIEAELADVVPAAVREADVQGDPAAPVDPALEGKVATLLAENAELRRELADLRRSTSWRLTQPGRSLSARLLKKRRMLVTQKPSG